MPRNFVTATLSAKRSRLALNSRLLRPMKGLAMTLSLWKIHFPGLRLNNPKPADCQDE